MFRESVPFDERLRQAERSLQRYSDKVPVIVETGEMKKRLFHKNSPDLPQLDKQKWLVPNSMTLAQFSSLIRKRFGDVITPQIAIFVLINNIMPKQTSMMRELWDDHHDEDKFLYITFVPENTFG